MRQHERQAVHTAPLHFAGGNELVNDHLGAVGEVAELSFPNDQGVGIVGSVAILKAKHSFFRQDGVDDHKRRLIFSNVLQRHVSTNVPLLTILIVNDSVSVCEGATAAIFTRQAHGITAGHQGSKSHVLAHAPIDGHVATAHGCTVVIDVFHQLMRCDTAWQGGDFFGNAFPFSQGQCSAACISPFLVQEWRPVHRELSFEVGQHGIAVGVLACIQCGAASFHHVVAQGVTQALCGQTIGEQLAGARMCADFLVHQGLCQARRVLLVVSQFAEANDVKNHILVEGHAVLERNLHGQHRCFWIVCVDVQHRRFHHLDDVGAIHRRTHVARV